MLLSRLEIIGRNLQIFVFDEMSNYFHKNRQEQVKDLCFKNGRMLKSFFEANFFVRKYILEENAVKNHVWVNASNNVFNQIG